MTDKKLLIILLLLAAYIFVVKPLNTSLKTKIFELRNLEKSIAKEKFIEKKAPQIKKLYPLYMKRAKKNDSLFFLENTSVSTSMSNMQKMLKRAIKTNDLISVSMNWGVAEKKDSYQVLPISFIVRGYPNQISGFIKSVLTSHKLFRFITYSVSKYRKKIVVRATVVGFKLKKKND